MDALQFAIARFLAAQASKQRRTTYQTLAHAIGWAHPTGRGLGKHLYAVLHFMKDKGLPPLTTVLVKKGQRHPDDDAMDYIRAALGEIDIEAAQAEVFKYNWAENPEFALSSKNLPGGDAIWYSSPLGSSTAFSKQSNQSFLLKFDGQRHGPNNNSRPNDPSDWNEGAVRIPSRGPDRTTRSDKSGGPSIQAGDTLFLWAHEDENYGDGLGMTAIANAAEVQEEKDFTSIKLRDLALLKSPFGFRVLGNSGWRSVILDRINEDRSPRAWFMTAAEKAEIEKVITDFGSQKSDAVADAESKHFTDLEKALKEEQDDVLAAENERRTTVAKSRPGQQKFRAESMARHNRRCVITGCNVNEALEAAHVIPHTGDPAFDVPENSLILRRDVHALFDAGLLAINQKSSRLMISKKLNSTQYSKLEGLAVDHKLDPAALRYHHNFYKRQQQPGNN